MRAESLEELGAAFRRWRATKRHLREAMPEELVERARLTARAFAELEMPNGVKVRLYSQTEQTLGLLSALCGGGGR